MPTVFKSPITRPYRIHVLYEHGVDRRPYVSSHVRLLRPLTHPSVSQYVRLSQGTELCDEHVDVVAVDRLWRPGITVDHAERLVDAVRRRGERLLYSLDDNLFAVDGGAGESQGSQRLVVEAFIRAADAVLVTTDRLASEVRPYTPHVLVLPNYLDERLLANRLTAGKLVDLMAGRWSEVRERTDTPLTIGYMGTLTHEADLQLIATALGNAARRHEGQIRLELVGGVRADGHSALLRDLPWYRLEPGQVYTEYSSFLPWFLATCRWDVALAPLADTALNNCKSDIKFLDYAAIGAVGLFSNAQAYRSTVQHGVTGFLIDTDPEAWDEALERSITGLDRTRTVGYLAQAYLYEARTLAVGAVHWLDVIRRCLRE